jgi:hypothetical protein
MQLHSFGPKARWCFLISDIYNNDTWLNIFVKYCFKNLRKDCDVCATTKTWLPFYREEEERYLKQYPEAISSKLEQAQLYFTPIISFVANYKSDISIVNQQSALHCKAVLSTNRAPLMQQNNFSSSRTSLEWGVGGGGGRGYHPLVQMSHRLLQV